MWNFAVYDLAFRRANQLTPGFHSTSNTPTIQISLVSSCSFLDEIEQSIQRAWRNGRVQVLSQHADRIDEEWKLTRKLGSLLSDTENIVCLKQTVYIRRLSEVVNIVAEATEDQPATSAEVLRVI